MFKRIFLRVTVLIFAFAILSISLIEARVGVSPISAAANLKFSVSPSPTATATPQPKVNYFLAYPGVLPDSSLYKIKMVRDQIRLWLTTDQTKKAELMLLYADKRIGAGKVLIEGNKISLGVSTLIKGQKYFENALTTASTVKKGGGNVQPLASQFRNALLKHEEVLVDLKEKISPDGKAAIDDLLQKIKVLREQALTLD